MLRLSDDAVSEVVGHILMFGILAMILILSLVGFNAAKDGADARVADANAESLAQRVASAVVDVALFAETSKGGDLRMHVLLDLPQQVQGQNYRIDLDVDEVSVSVSGRDRTSSAPLFASGTPSEVAICDQAEFNGGPLSVRVTSTPPAGDCGAPPQAELYVYLESAS